MQLTFIIGAEIIASVRVEDARQPVAVVEALKAHVINELVRRAALPITHETRQGRCSMECRIEFT